jgi:hypothetical protein
MQRTRNEERTAALAVNRSRLLLDAVIPDYSGLCLLRNNTWQRQLHSHMKCHFIILKYGIAQLMIGINGWCTNKMQKSIDNYSIRIEPLVYETLSELYVPVWNSDSIPEKIKKLMDFMKVRCRMLHLMNVLVKLNKQVLIK